MKNYSNLFQQIISSENLFLSWEEFVKDKRKKKDVLEFEWNLEERILELHRDLKYHTYKHDVYTGFIITDPKQRHIHKATVRDRIVHHAIYRILYPIFDRSFIYDSYSCRLNKGTHKAVGQLEKFVRKVSKIYNAPCFALKCDIKKFFDSVDHQMLLGILKKKISDEDALWLLEEIIFSYSSSPFDKLRINSVEKFSIKSYNKHKQLSFFEDFSALPQNDGCKLRESSDCAQDFERERERETTAFGCLAKGFLSAISPASYSLTFTCMNLMNLSSIN